MRGLVCGLIALLQLHCSHAMPPVAGAPPSATPERALPAALTTHEAEDVCPYVRAMLDWWPRADAPGADAERIELSLRVLREFGARLPEYGFVLVDDVEDTYWTVNAIASYNVFDRDMTHGHVRMRAIADFDGKALRYDFSTPGEPRDQGALFELRTFDLDVSVRELADQIAAGLRPHTRRMCDDWESGLLEEEARLERLRRELVAEIEQVRSARRNRSSGEQRRQLELEASTLVP